MNLKKKEIGSTDSPCEMPENDLLGTRRYVEGLAGFIKDCQTPMSIAIQGTEVQGKPPSSTMYARL